MCTFLVRTILFQFQCIDKSLFCFLLLFIPRLQLLLLLVSSSSSSTSLSMSIEPMHNACQWATRFEQRKCQRGTSKLFMQMRSSFFIGSVHHKNAHSHTNRYAVTIPIQVTLISNQCLHHRCHCYAAALWLSHQLKIKFCNKTCVLILFRTYWQTITTNKSYALTTHNMHLPPHLPPSPSALHKFVCLGVGVNRMH